MRGNGRTEQLERTQEFDPRILQRIQAREQRKNVHGDVATVLSQDSGTYGIVEPVQPREGAAARTVADRAAEAFQTMFNPNDPIESVQDIAFELNDEVDRLGQPVRMTFLHFYGDPGSNQINYVSLSVGGGYAYQYPSDERDTEYKYEQVTDSQDPSKVLDGSPAATDNVFIEMGTVGQDDRMAIVSWKLEENSVDGGLDEAKHLKVRDASSIRGAAKSLVGRKKADRDKVGIIIDVLEEGSRGKVKTASARSIGGVAMFDGARGSTSSSQYTQPSGRHKVRIGDRFNRQRFSRERIVGTARQIRSDRKDRRGDFRRNYKTYKDINEDKYKDKTGLRRGLGRAGLVFWGLNSAHTATKENRRQSRMERWRRDPLYNGWEEEHVTRHLEKRDRRRVEYGLAVAAALIGYRHFADPGTDGGTTSQLFGVQWPEQLNALNEIPTGWGEENDKGVDSLTRPFDTGDRTDGDGRGADWSPDNRGKDWNDDPVRPHIDMQYDSILPDIFPTDGPFGDGDPMAWPRWLPGVPDAPRITLDPGDLPPAPRLPDFGPPMDVDAPEIPPMGPVLPPAEPNPPTVNIPNGPDVLVDFDAWEEEIAAGSGDGNEDLLHEWGHDVVGYDNFDGDDAHEAYLELEKAGIAQDYLRFEDGRTATYPMANGDSGIAGEGRVEIADERHRRIVYDILVNTAKD